MVPHGGKHAPDLVVQSLANGNHHGIAFDPDFTGKHRAAFVLEHHALQKLRFLFGGKRARQTHAVILEHALLGALDPVDKVALVAQEQQAFGVRVQAAHALDTHRGKAIGQKRIHRFMVTRVVAALHVGRLVEHHVELFLRGDFLAVHGNALRPLLELHERVVQHLAIQFHEAHAHQSAGFLAAAKTDTCQKAVQSQSGHYSSTIQPTIFLRINPSSGSSPVLSTRARLRQNSRNNTAAYTSVTNSR